MSKINVCNFSYAVAATTENVITYKRGSTVADSNIELALYDRWIRIQDVQAIKLPIFMNLLRTHIPVGVQVILNWDTLRVVY